MKLTHLAAAALITLSSLTAQAAYLQLNGGTNTTIPNSNYYKASVNPQSYNIGGNLESSFDGLLSIEFSYLGAEAGWKNTLTSGPFSIDNILPSPSFVLPGDYSVGELIPFSFTTGGAGVVPNTVVNGNNNNGDHWVSFATALNATFNSTLYDAILFFDDTGGYNDDDNHDDLVIGVRVLSATTRTVPESSTFALMLMGLAGLFAARRMKA